MLPITVIGPLTAGASSTSTRRNSSSISLHHMASKPIELDVVDGRQEARLAEAVGPGAGILAGELVVDVVQRQFLECGSGFSEQQMPQRVVW